eukprot:TRINITY_DN997_c0_g1_i2.p1 TRINITY_DN997_c0_g1~~TRINITY_DN997_c0_g1_i2.p1  ORF type:complete len:255 (-),score=26.96 TRINITY_DN997_c0_g1_i2:365-1129(-)
MIHSLIITTRGGTVLFEKVWVSSAHTTGKANMFASLITAMQEFSRQATGGLLVSHLSFGQVSLSMSWDERTQLRAVLTHDAGDGYNFGQLLAQQLLRGFIDSYAQDTEFSSAQGLSPQRFLPYVNKVLDQITQSIRSILVVLHRHRGLLNTFLVHDDGRATTTDAADDQLGIAANLTPLIAFSSEIMLHKADRPRVITLEMGKQVIEVHRVGPASLVCICRKNKDPSVYRSAIQNAVQMLEKVFLLLRDLSGRS